MMGRKHDEFKVRRAIQLHAQGGLSYTEIAQRLGVSKDAVRDWCQKDKAKRKAAEAFEKAAWMDELP